MQAKVSISKIPKKFPVNRYMQQITRKNRPERSNKAGRTLNLQSGVISIHPQLETMKNRFFLETKESD